MKNHVTYCVIIKFFMLLFWLAIIVAFLFSPRVISWFYSPISINVYTFPQLLDVHYLTRFEQETGIKVYVSYYENNDELLVKMRQTGGQGYDIIIPSDYAVAALVNDGLLQRIDKTKLPFWRDIDLRLLGHYFDPRNEYSIPYFWGLYGIGIDTKNIGAPIMPSWKMIFEQPAHEAYTIGMINNAREAVLLAAYYLFGSIHDLDQSKLAQIQQLLLHQKKWVSVYTDVGPDYLLLSHSCPVVVSLSSEVWQAQRFNDDIEFVIPKEGTFMVIDNIAISASSAKSDLVYQFINFLYRPSTLAHHINNYSYFPPMIADQIAHTKEIASFTMLDEIVHLNFFQSDVPESALQAIWLALKVH